MPKLLTHQEADAEVQTAMGQPTSSSKDKEGRMAKEVRTTMYNIDEQGRVVVHKFPYDGSDPFGMAKLQKFVNRGFTFEDPRKVLQAPSEVLQAVPQELFCECGKGPFKSAFGLGVHKRRHL